MIIKEQNKHIICLELDRVLKIVSDEAHFDDSKNKILSLCPNFDFSETKRALDRTKSAYELAAKFGTPRLSGVKNISEPLRRSKNGGSLSLKELLTVAEVLRNIYGLCQYREQFSGMETDIDDYFNSLSPNKYLEEKIFTSIVSEDTVSDNASQLLSDLRRSIRRENQQIREKLDKIIHSQSHQKHLQDAIVTQRDGRFVIPVKQEHRSEIDGLVHDISSSGATIFIEPTVVVEANNRIRILEAKERGEIIRIIAELSSEVANFADSIEMSYSAVVEIDVVFAMANYAYKTKSVVPFLNDNGITELKKARHPLIPSDRVVPIDIRLGKDFSVLVITGPNTGGKTVALKTLGLFTLMAMCGLMIPAGDGSEISIFDSVFADIGDEQSIEQSLSTFSSHMVNIIDILKNIGKRSLVLLDEVGAGTDPIEGAALAVSIIESVKSTGAFAAVTTHYAEMKAYALETEGVENACCEFDVVSLKPTYRLMIGIPGRSNAFAISEKLGLDKDIIENAKKYISAEDTRFEDVIQSLEMKKKEVDEEKTKLQRLADENKQLNEKLKRKTENIYAEADKRLENASEQAKALVADVSFKAQKLLDELDELKKQKDKKDFRDKYSDAKSGLRAQLNKLEQEADPVVKKKKRSGKLPRALIMGDSVRIVDIDKEATVISLPDGSGNLFVRVGIMKMKANIKNVELIENSVTVIKSNKINTESRAVRSVKTEIDIRGTDSVEGVIEVERFIDAAIMSGLGSITIIHGKGTGVLRKAVWDRLKTHKNVKSYRNGTFGEGEMGVTVVELK